MGAITLVGTVVVGRLGWSTVCDNDNYTFKSRTSDVIVLEKSTFPIFSSALAEKLRKTLMKVSGIA